MAGSNNKCRAQNTAISTFAGSGILAASIGFSGVGSLILGVAIGYYFYRYEMEKEV